MLKIKHSVFIFSLAGLFLLSCSTKKNTAIARFWHRTNTHYNGWFNGNEAIKEGMQQLNKSRKDDFTKTIPVFEYGDISNFSGMDANSDKAIKKAVIMIKKHSMFINGQQYNKWIDDCYMLMGKAHFFKKEHNLGLAQLRHVMDNSEKQYTKDEARIWMIRTMNEMNEFSETGATIRGIDIGKLDKRLLSEYYGVVAEYQIKQKEWEKAIESFDEGVKYTKSKHRKARWEFIKGQLYEKLGNNEKAYESYEKALKYKPEYILDFQSRINMAKTSTNSNKEDLRKLLTKMLKDEKNDEYQDQIYYGLGMIDLGDDKKSDAIVNFQKSLSRPSSNQNQKAITYLQMGELHLGIKKYETAQAYYDSTSTTLAKDHPKFDEVLRIKENLTDLVTNIKIVETQDSLQRLSKMSDADLKTYFEEYIVRLKEYDEKMKNAPVNPNNFSSSGNPNGKWYFTNSTVLNFGKEEFKKTWGTIVLEDDWRRSNKSTSFLNETVDTSNTEEAANPRYEVETYLAAIPKGDSAIRASTEMIYQALYNIGTIYKDKILDNNLSIENYEELVKRCTNKSTSKHFPITYFQLYTLYYGLKNDEKADEYKNIILTQYPNSDYAQLIIDPVAYTNKQNNNDQTVLNYNSAYGLYDNADYTGAINICNNELTTNKKSKLAHRFALLKALCIDKINGREAFVLELKTVVKEYDGSESANTAQRLLDKIEGKKENVSELVEESFKYDTKEQHYVVVYIPDATKKMSTPIGKLVEFNDTEFSNKSIKVTNVIMPANGQLILMKTFNDEADAKTYITKYNEKNLAMTIPYNTTVRLMMISVSNYAIFMKSDRVKDYLSFYATNYK